IAAATMSLSPEAAAHVARHVCFVAHRVRTSQLDRLFAEAIARFMPAEAERIARAAADGRHVTFYDQPSFTGTVHVEAELELADARDFAAAVTDGAASLAALGSTDGLGARRAATVGEMARRDLALDLTGAEQDEPRDRRRARRRVHLVVHLSDAAVQAPGNPGGTQVARVESAGNTLVLADQVRAWCRGADTQVVVRAVIDLADHVRVEQYEVPERISERVALRDGACVFPWCTRPARRCDDDHVVPHSRGGPTCTCNLAPLCRHHHRLKTHTSWHYLVLEPGSFLWTSPHGHQFLRDHAGTSDVTRRDRSCDSRR
ncbi:MAG: HNH endonuclease signature motif containing protein, partial [Nocardioides sp.]